MSSEQYYFYNQKPCNSQFIQKGGTNEFNIETTSWSKQDGCSHKYAKSGRLGNISADTDSYGEMGVRTSWTELCIIAKWNWNCEQYFNANEYIEYSYRLPL